MHNYPRDKRHAEGEIMDIISKTSIETLKEMGYEVAEENWTDEQSSELLIVSGYLTKDQFSSAGFNIKMSPEEMQKLTMDIFMDGVHKDMSTIFGRA